MDSLRGCLLISSGGIYDPNFRHTVVLVGEHNTDGALGVVLNRATNVTVEQAVPALRELVPPDEPPFQGGPVEPGGPVLLAELARPELADILVFQSVGFLVDAPDLLWSNVLQRKGPEYRPLSRIPYDPSTN